MTEDEAKTKWCPAAKNDGVNEMCIASGCMAWKWDEAFDRAENGELTGGTNYDTEGHCGLTK